MTQNIQFNSQDTFINLNQLKSELVLIICLFPGMETTSTLTSETCTSTWGVWGTLLRCSERPLPALMPASMVRTQKTRNGIRHLMGLFSCVCAEDKRLMGCLSLCLCKARCWWWTVRRSISPKRSLSSGETSTTACRSSSSVTGTTPRSWGRSSSMTKTPGM